jgi:hypothetical protein
MEVDPAALTGPGSFLAGLDSQMKPAVATVRQEIPQLVGNFELITEETLEFADVRVAKWRSKETGLKVVWADVEGESQRGVPGGVELTTVVQVLLFRDTSLSRLRSSTIAVFPTRWSMPSSWDLSSELHRLANGIGTDNRIDTPSRESSTLLRTECLRTAPTRGLIRPTRPTPSELLVQRDSSVFCQCFWTMFCTRESPSPHSTTYRD